MVASGRLRTRRSREQVPDRGIVSLAGATGGTGCREELIPIAVGIVLAGDTAVLQPNGAMAATMARVVAAVTAEVQVLGVVIIIVIIKINNIISITAVVVVMAEASGLRVVGIASGQRLVGRLGILLLDEGVDDVVLHGVHDEGKDHHAEGNLQALVALGPAQGPVADGGDPGEEDEDEEDAELHGEEAAEVDDGLLEPPEGVGRVAVVAGLDRLRRPAEGGPGREGGGQSEEEDEDRDAGGCL